MKIIKRNGAEVPFDITKIITAVTKASDSVGGQSRLTREQITQIAAAVTDQCQALNRAVSVAASASACTRMVSSAKQFRNTSLPSVRPSAPTVSRHSFRQL